MDGHGGAPGTADANGEDCHALVCGSRGGSQHRALQVLAIGQEHQHPVVVAIVIEEALGFLDRTGQIGALARDEFGIERVQRFAERVVVEGERAQRKGTAGEWNQADPVAFEAGHEIEDAEARALEPVGC